jgi:hypothetical protein
MRLPGFITFTSAPHIVCHSCSPFSAIFYNKIHSVVNVFWLFCGWWYMNMKE